MDDTIEPMSTTIDQEQLAQDLAQTARADGVSLIGPGGLLTGLTKSVLETVLEVEMVEHWATTSTTQPAVEDVLSSVELR